MFQDETRVFIAVIDYMAALAHGVAGWMPPNFEVLGTDGYGLSESRTRLREHFPVDAMAVTKGAISELYRNGLLDRSRFESTMHGMCHSK